MKNIIINKIAKVHRIKYVTPLKARGQIKKIYKQANKEFGLAADPILLHSGSPEFLQLYYALGREILLVKNHLSRIVKDYIATVISKENECPYCEDVHSISVTAQDDRISFQPFFKDSVNESAEQRHIMDLLKAEFNITATAIVLEEVYAVAFYFHYTNRMVNIFVDGSQIPDSFWKNFYVWLGQKFMKKYTSLSFLTEGIDKSSNGIISDSFNWIENNTVIKNRLISIDTFLSARINKLLPAEIINLLQDMLQEWDGGSKPMNAKWLSDSIEHIPIEKRDLATLILSVAFASYRVTDDLIARIYKKGIDNSTVLFITGWSAFEAAKRKIELLRSTKKEVDHVPVNQVVIL